MSFIDCPECGHYDSVAAVTCPACGADRADLIQELTAIDLQWERDRHQYMIPSKHGQKMIPTKGFAAIVVALTLVAGIGFVKFFSPVIRAQFTAAAGFGALVAGMLIVFGLGIGVWCFLKALAYEEAHAAYLGKKSAAQAKYAGQAECLA